MNAVAKFDDVLLAVEYVSADQPMEHEAYLCRATGAIHYHTEFGDNEEPLPGDIADTDRYVALPHKNELGLGKRLALQFAEEVVPDDAQKVSGFFQHRGAYGHFKELLERRGVLQQWFEFEARSTNEALRRWCEENEIDVRS